MSLHQVSNVGSTENEAPEMVWEVLVEVLFDPRLSPEEIGKLQDKLSRRLHKTVRDTLGAHQFNPGLPPTVLELHGRGESTPLFPLLAGRTRFTCNLDVLQMIEQRCQRTDLQKIAFDARGRAYALDVEVVYIRYPELDGAATAPMPDPAEVVRVAEERRRTPLTAKWKLPVEPAVRRRRNRDAH